MLLFIGWNKLKQCRTADCVQGAEMKILQESTVQEAGAVKVKQKKRRQDRDCCSHATTDGFHQDQVNMH
jgi:hypothetical protein